ncbi:MAG: class I SAM-dependent methyltransferase [Blastocatellia bacterium]
MRTLERRLLYVQYGCGQHSPSSWLNYDVSPTLRLQKLPVVKHVMNWRGRLVFSPNVRYGDIRKRLPLPAESCRAIYCSHVLEHLALNDFYVALANTYWHLEKGGIFRFVMPDLKSQVEDYLSSTSPNASIRFMEYTGLGKRSRPHGLLEIIRNVWGNSHHLWMWDEQSMRIALADVGFRQIRRAQFNDNPDSRFHDVETPQSWGITEGYVTLGMECIK